jgi:hypothetical protein
MKENSDSCFRPIYVCKRPLGYPQKETRFLHQPGIEPGSVPWQGTIHLLKFNFYINFCPYFYNCYLLFPYHFFIEIFYLSNLVLIFLIVTYFIWNNLWNVNYYYFNFFIFYFFLIFYIWSLLFWLLFILFEIIYEIIFFFNFILIHLFNL